MLVRVMEAQNVIKRAVKISLSVPEVVKTHIHTAIIHPTNSFTENEVKDHIFHEVEIEKEGMYTGLDGPHSAEYKSIDFALGLQLH